ncbi:RteC domain-containing protein [Chitinophaga sp. YIM B06452]|uniref:RteC domain-containing protein n=1 Tax=Chitinophaga sp. YIM B06452 TaxID=3082158 RepID=UPI0031FE9CC2
MKNLSALLDEMLSGLQTIVPNAENPVKDYIQAVELVSRAIRDLETRLMEYTFSDPEEEIHFFKHIRPQFDGRLIYYLRLIDLESRMPEGGKEKLQFLRRQLRRIKAYYRHYKDFYRYLLTGATNLDQYYFIRTDMPDPAYMDDFYHAYDPKCNTRLSYKAGKMRACKLLSEFIKDAMLDLTGEGTADETKSFRLTWRAQKVDLAELIYGLHALKVFGNISLQQTVKAVTAAFNVQFANPYKVFEEIRLRKKNRTAFTEEMRMALERQMEHDI